jgi:hypothetical protein
VAVGEKEAKLLKLAQTLHMNTGHSAHSADAAAAAAAPAAIMAAPL